MKKLLKDKPAYSDQEITITISEELNKLKGKVLAPKQLAEINELLSKAKKPFPWENK